MYMIIATLLIAAALANAILFWMVLRQPWSYSRNLFGGHIVCVILWSLSVLAVIQLEEPIYMHLVFVFAALALTALMLFVLAFPENQLNYIHTSFLLFVGFVFATASLLPGGVFSTFSVDPLGYAVIKNGFLSAPYSLFVILYIIVPIFILWRKARTVKERQTQNQLHFLVLAFLVFLGINLLTNSILPVFFGIYFFNSIGPVFSLILAAFVFYIIWRHEFLDIKIVIQRGLIYLGLSGAFVAAYFGLNFGLAMLFSLSTHTNALLSAFVTLCAAALAIYAVERYFEKVHLLKKEKEYAALLECEVAERTKHLQELQEYQRRMMDDISHAIQTPVTVIQSAMEGAHRGTPNVKTYQTVEKSIDDLSRLARDFLHLSRLESLPGIQREIFPLSDMILEITEYADIVCKEQGINLRQTIEHHDVSVYADKSHIEELIRNLLSNAIKYTKDSVRRDIHIILKRAANYAEIRIEDTGIGITKEALPHIFERFFRANDSQKGVGLGLSICKRLVELHGGEIAAESIEGRGTTITVRLPAASVAQVRLS